MGRKAGFWGNRHHNVFTSQATFNLAYSNFCVIDFADITCFKCLCLYMHVCLS